MSTNYNGVSRLFRESVRFSNKNPVGNTYRSSKKEKMNRNIQLFQKDASMQRGETFHPWNEKNYYNRSSVDDTSASIKVDDLLDLLFEIYNHIGQKIPNIPAKNETTLKNAYTLLRNLNVMYQSQRDLSRYDSHALEYIKKYGYNIKAYQATYHKSYYMLFNKWSQLDEHSKDFNYELFLDMVKDMNNLLCNLRIIEIVDKHNKELARPDGGSRKSRRTRRARKTRRLVRK
jgi:hypothetical protein